AFAGGIAVAGADREIALGGGADAADAGAGIVRELLGAPARVLDRFADHRRLDAVEPGEAVDHRRAFLQRDALPDQIELARISAARAHHVGGAELQAAVDGHDVGGAVAVVEAVDRSAAV